ncbi:hypothetical protein ACQ4PT_032114 [Festuca glaucescens]
MAETGTGDHELSSRVHRGKIPEGRDPDAGRVSALESAMRGFANRTTDFVIDPALGTEFDSLSEAYDFYNLYSWEIGFGIRYGHSRKNVAGNKTVQEIICGCGGKPQRSNNTSICCECPARVVLHRTDDHGWYISDHKSNHNHRLSETCAEKRNWPSHRNIDNYTKDLIRHLRENNVNLSKVYCVTGSFFGSLGKVPFNKRSLRTLCAKINHEHSDDDVLKTMEVFREMRAQDPEFVDSVRVDGDSRVRALMWFDDQCRAMEVAIEDVLPDTTHRWCKWHVLRKAKERLGPVYSKNSGFRDEFHKIINIMLTTDEFECAWGFLIEKYGLQNQPFLTQIYEQYAKLQFDRESEESFEEKRTKLVSLSCGGCATSWVPIELHASKVYTAAMYELFRKIIFESGAYVVEVVVPKLKYIARHVQSERRERWSKVSFEVNVSGDGDAYNCECGHFDHTGLLCCHALWVMINLGVQEIPKYHIMKRWTKDARDILPEHLARYQKDSGPARSQTFRHSTLYISALKFVKMGGANVQSYHVLMVCFAGAESKLAEVSVKRDGMSLDEKESNAEATGSSMTIVETNVDFADPAVRQRLHEGVKPPDRKRKLGRPTNARDKPGYEVRVQRSRYCTGCHTKGHTITTCLMRSHLPKNLEGRPLAAIVVSLVIGRQIARYRLRMRWLACENSCGVAGLGGVLVLSTDLSKCCPLLMVGKMLACNFTDCL